MYRSFSWVPALTKTRSVGLYPLALFRYSYAIQQVKLCGPDGLLTLLQQARQWEAGHHLGRKESNWFAFSDDFAELLYAIAERITNIANVTDETTFSRNRPGCQILPRQAVELLSAFACHSPTLHIPQQLLRRIISILLTCVYPTTECSTFEVEALVCGTQTLLEKLRCSTDGPIQRHNLVHKQLTHGTVSVPFKQLIVATLQRVVATKVPEMAPEQAIHIGLRLAEMGILVDPLLNRLQNLINSNEIQVLAASDLLDVGRIWLLLKLEGMNTICHDIAYEFVYHRMDSSATPAELVGLFSLLSRAGIELKYSFRRIMTRLLQLYPEEEKTFKVIVQRTLGTVPDTEGDWWSGARTLPEVSEDQNDAHLFSLIPEQIGAATSQLFVGQEFTEVCRIDGAKLRRQFCKDLFREHLVSQIDSLLTMSSIFPRQQWSSDVTLQEQQNSSHEGRDTTTTTAAVVSSDGPLQPQAVPSYLELATIRRKHESLPAAVLEILRSSVRANYYQREMVWVLGELLAAGLETPRTYIGRVSRLCLTAIRNESVSNLVCAWRFFAAGEAPVPSVVVASLEETVLRRLNELTPQLLGSVLTTLLCGSPGLQAAYVPTAAKRMNWITELLQLPIQTVLDMPTLARAHLFNLFPLLGDYAVVTKPDSQPSASAAKHRDFASVNLLAFESSESHWAQSSLYQSLVSDLRAQAIAVFATRPECARALQKRGFEIEQGENKIEIEVGAFRAGKSINRMERTILQSSEKSDPSVSPRETGALCETLIDTSLAQLVIRSVAKCFKGKGCRDGLIPESVSNDSTSIVALDGRQVPSSLSTAQSTGNAVVVATPHQEVTIRTNVLTSKGVCDKTLDDANAKRFMKGVYCGLLSFLLLQDPCVRLIPGKNCSQQTRVETREYSESWAENATISLSLLPTQTLKEFRDLLVLCETYQNVEERFVPAHRHRVPERKKSPSLLQRTFKRWGIPNRFYQEDPDNVYDALRRFPSREKSTFSARNNSDDSAATKTENVGRSYTRKNFGKHLTFRERRQKRLMDYALRPFTANNRSSGQLCCDLNKGRSPTDIFPRRRSSAITIDFRRARDLLRSCRWDLHEYLHCRVKNGRYKETVEIVPETSIGPVAIDFLVLKSRTNSKIH